MPEVRALQYYAPNRGGSLYRRSPVQGRRHRQSPRPKRQPARRHATIQVLSTSETPTIVILRLILTVVILGLLAAAVYGYRQQQDDAIAQRMASGPAPATITATVAREQPWAARIDAVGSLQAVQDVAIASEVTGKVIDVSFESGSIVEAGTVLVQLDDSDDRAQLDALNAELELARLENDRVLNLRRSAAFSQSQLDRTQSQMASLRAQVDRQQALIRKKQLRAPFTGTLGIRRVSLGEIVQPGDAIVQLLSLAPIYVDFTVPERFRAQIEAGQALQVSVAAWPDDTFAGHITAISPAVDVRTRTLSLRGDLANSDGRLQPGMFTTVHVLLGAQQPTLTLPRTAISFFAYGESVFVIEVDEAQHLTVRRQPIRVGRTRQGQVEVLSGLTAGQRVVHTGHMKLRDGQTVVINDGIALPQNLEDG